MFLFLRFKSAIISQLHLRNSEQIVVEVKSY